MRKHTRPARGGWGRLPRTTTAVARAVHVEKFADVRAMAELAAAEWRAQAARASRPAKAAKRLDSQLRRRTDLHLASLEALRAQDHRRVVRDLHQAEVRARRVAIQQRNAQRRQLRDFLTQRERIEYTAGNPTTLVCLWQAREILTSSHALTTSKPVRSLAHLRSEPSLQSKLPAAHAIGSQV